jgi:ABC-type branched-subunit amino acid transport system ATPase component
LAALTLEGVNAFYGKAHIVRNVSLSVGAGEIVGIVGRNGVGKTTLLRSVMNLVPTVHGKVTLKERNISKESTDSRVRGGLGYMPQGMRVFGELSVEENYRVCAYAARTPMALEAILALVPELREFLKRPAGRLSGGQQQLVSLMRCLASNCSVLLMDEPTEGLMPKMVERIAEVANSLRKRGIAIILVEQNLALAEAVCDRGYIMEKGAIEAEGDFHSLRMAGEFERRLGVGRNQKEKEST